MKILVAYDRSIVAKEAVKLSKVHSEAFNAKVYLIYNPKNVH